MIRQTKLKTEIPRRKGGQLIRWPAPFSSLSLQGAGGGSKTARHRGRISGYILFSDSQLILDPKSQKWIAHNGER
jgi:hypothetical protein